MILNYIVGVLCYFLINFAVRITNKLKQVVLKMKDNSYYVRRSLVASLFGVSIAMSAFAQSASLFPMEKLDRGVVALPAKDKGNFVSWRLLGTDSSDVMFDLLRDGKVIASGMRLTNFTDADGGPDSQYQVMTHQGSETQRSSVVTPWADLYLSVPLSRPEGGSLDGRDYTYSPNDCSVGDVDGDGEYEIILKWDPSNAHDNSHNGKTGNVFFDCYKLDGKQLWRIDLGRNIRAGAHYTQFLVYDFDGDGKAEMICKTSAGSVDGCGKFVSEAATEEDIRQTDNQADYRNEKGHILEGPEFLTVFNGQTGKAVHTVWYNPNRGYGVGGHAKYAGWGDRAIEGNRGERYLAGVAYLDGEGKLPSAVMCRGYYTRSYLWAVDFRDGQLRTKWLHASLSPAEWRVTDGEGKVAKEGKDLKATAYGQGAHSLAVGDVDGDGCDEITYGSAAIDHDGALLYSTGLGHGDALHLSDLDPDHPGLECFMVHEASPYGADLRDARTGEILYRQYGKEDTGRGLAADIDASHRGCEFWTIDGNEVHAVHGDTIARASMPVNFRIYWDGDLQDELVANGNRPARFVPFLAKWTGKQAEPLPLSNGKHLYEMGHSASCNWSKATPNLQADILGDWREEIIYWDKSDAAHLNIFTTNIPTSYRVPTLMHDHVYRLGVAWQNVGYNQPPHLGYYLPDAVAPCK